MQVIRNTDLHENRWSGGTTTQLCIFPASADYKKMDFDFRISTATIETETSTFTALPGVSRILMVLDGVLELHHRDQHSTILHPFETDSFSGEWETTSHGKATDFNLMIRRADLSGTVRCLLLGKKSNFSLTAGKHGFLYLYKGDISVGDIPLKAGDSVYLDAGETINILGKNNATVIHVNLQ